MIITQKITVQLDHREELPAVDMVQGDTGRSLAISLILQGKAWTIPDSVKALIRYHRSDGSGGCYDTLPNGTTAYGISDSTITIYPISHLTAVAGIVELQVALMVGEVTLTVFTVLLSVQADPSLEALEPEDYPSLSGWIQDEMDRRWDSVFNNDGYINSKVNDLHFRSDVPFTLGTLSTTDGGEDTSGTHIRSGFIAHGGREMTVVIPEGVQALVYFYDKNYAFVSRTGIYSETFTAYYASAYARVVAFYADEAAVPDAATLAQKITVCYRSDAHSQFRGDIVLLGIKYFALCKQEGYYRFSTEDLNLIGDAPDLGCGGILEVKPYASGASRLQIIRTTDGQVWSRFGTQSFQRLVPPAEGTSSFTDAVKQALTTETWTFTLEDNTTVEKAVLLG